MSGSSPNPTGALSAPLVAEALQALAGARHESEAALFHAVAGDFGRWGLRCALLAVEDDGHTLRVREATLHPLIVRAEHLAGVSARGQAFPTARVPSLAEALRTARPVFVPDAHAVVAQAAPEVAQAALKSVLEGAEAFPGLHLPLVRDDRVAGVLTVSGLGVTSADLPLIQMYASALSLLWASARAPLPEMREVCSVVSAILRAGLRATDGRVALEAALDVLVGRDSARSAAIWWSPPGSTHRPMLLVRGERGAFLERFLGAPNAEGAPAGLDPSESGAGGWVGPLVLRESRYGWLGVDGLSGGTAAARLVWDAVAEVAAAHPLSPSPTPAAHQGRQQRLAACAQTAGSLAVEFTHLINGIQLTAQLARDEAGDVEGQLYQDLQEIAQSCDRASRLTRQLRLFSGRHLLSPRPLDLGAFLRQQRGHLQDALGARITLDLVVDPAPWVVWIDHAAFEQALDSLVENARESQPRGGSVLVSVSNYGGVRHPLAGEAGPSDWVQVVVADHGVGMDAAMVQRVFEPFFTTKVDPGAGLGLAVVYGVIQGAGGWVDVDSRPGDGTTVTLWIPRAEARPAAVQARRVPAPLRGGERRVLVVEDDPILGDLVVRLLRRQGLNPHLACSAREALKWVSDDRDRVDGVIADVVLPDGDGLALVLELTRRQPSLAVLMMSGHLDEYSHRLEIESLGFAFLPKPFSRAELASRVDDIFRWQDLGPGA